jgi:hypothetical protein
MTTAEVLDFDSTLIRRGRGATMLSEMAEFAVTVERRPLDKLLAELPAMATLSSTKFGLAQQVLRRRMRRLAPVDREQLRVLAMEIADGTAPEVGDRIRETFVES